MNIVFNPTIRGGRLLKRPTNTSKFHVFSDFYKTLFYSLIHGMVDKEYLNLILVTKYNYY